MILSFVYINNILGIPKEIWQNERRVSIVPATVSVLAKKGIKINIEENAGKEARFDNHQYESAGAKILSRNDLFAQSDVLFKIRPPILDKETYLFRDGQTLISLLMPAQNKDLVDVLARKKMNVFAVDCIPRISRAQTFDVLSSMANIAGYFVEIIYFFFILIDLYFV